MELTVDELDSLDNPLIVDVRSPEEYREDHLPGAINLPVLDNDERDRIGTIYNKESQFKARREGAKAVCRNVPAILDAIEKQLDPDQPLLVYCWRGGQRSQSLAIILNRIGYDVHRLDGGYKAYRGRVHDYLRDGGWKTPIMAIFGYTGSGKTAVLRELRSHGLSALDLEGAANHRGSAFGGVGLGDQPSQKTFERNLYTQLKDREGPIFTEGESRKIGRRIIPDALFDRLCEPPRIWLDVPRDVRVENIRTEYPWERHREALIDKVENLSERLGNETVEALQEKLRRGKLSAVIETLLKNYYDPAYEKSSPDPGEFEFQVEARTIDDAIDSLEDLAGTAAGSS